MQIMAKYAVCVYLKLILLWQTLENSGWEVLNAEAGVSIVAKPSAYFGKTIKLNDGSGSREIKIDDTNIRESMLTSTGLCINSASWTGIPGYCRFTIALEDKDFKRALDCITQFKRLVSWVEYYVHLFCNASCTLCYFATILSWNELIHLPNWCYQPKCMNLKLYVSEHACWVQYNKTSHWNAMWMNYSHYKTIGSKKWV